MKGRDLRLVIANCYHKKICPFGGRRSAGIKSTIVCLFRHDDDDESCACGATAVLLSIRMLVAVQPRVSTSFLNSSTSFNCVPITWCVATCPLCAFAARFSTATLYYYSSDLKKFLFNYCDSIDSIALHRQGLKHPVVSTNARIEGDRGDQIRLRHNSVLCYFSSRLRQGWEPCVKPEAVQLVGRLLWPQ